MEVIEDERFLVVAAALACGAVLLAVRLILGRKRVGAASRTAAPFSPRGATAAGDSKRKDSSGVVTAPASPAERQEREPGEWTPVAFDYPRVEPCAEAALRTKPVPYRPFKWGEYHVTMGIRSMPWDEWLEVDEQFPMYHAIRERRVAERGDRLVRTLPETPGVVQGGRDAAVELIHELAEYLSRRHPDMYHVVRHSPSEDASGWYGEPGVKEITIVPLNKMYNLDEADPMVVSALLVQEDLALMIEGVDGQLYLQAGAILIPGSWRLVDKIGMHLDEIHLSGAVPQFEKKLQPSMTRFLRKMDVSKPVQRTNYTFQVVAPAENADARDPDELAWMHTMKGDEDAAHGDGPGGNFSVAYSDLSAAQAEEPVDPARVRMRVERQTLRRLPRTGAVVFTIRVYLSRLEELVKEPDVPGRMASAIRSWPEDVATYKGRAAIESILEYLDEHHDLQRQQAERT